MKYRYIEFKLLEKKSKTSVWECLNINSSVRLGIVKWYPYWRQYCYFPEKDTVYSVGCLEDINDFITQLMMERKIKKEEE